MTMFDRALEEKGPGVREALSGGGWEDDGKHVFVASYARSDGSPEISVWKTFEGLVGCIARLQFFEPDLSVSAHWLLVNEENNG